MQLLLTSDLHRDGLKFLWLLEEAPYHEGLLVAGDFLDLFSRASFEDQQSGTLHWMRSILETDRFLACCSGNHDFLQEKHSPKVAASPHWMHAAPSPACVTDGESRLLEIGGNRVVITTVPWPLFGSEIVADGRPISYPDFVEDLMYKGKELREKQRVPWVCLFHEPPAETPLCVTYYAPGAGFVREVIERFAPDFSLHGHIHQAPTTPSGSWICRLGKTVCFNAGQSEPGNLPYHILLNLGAAGTWDAEWHADGMISKADSTQ